MTWILLAAFVISFGWAIFQEWIKAVIASPLPPQPKVDDFEEEEE
tara:strand:+ start:1352 stop:1486 length:135 start_codon:yes stop_codon:yes gene_type:complete